MISQNKLECLLTASFFSVLQHLQKKPSPKQLVNIRINWKWLLVTNTLAYFVRKNQWRKKSFIKLLPETVERANIN
jgi:hypothetical protein